MSEPTVDQVCSQDSRDEPDVAPVVGVEYGEGERDGGQGE